MEEISQDRAKRCTADIAKETNNLEQSSRANRRMPGTPETAQGRGRKRRARQAGAEQGLSSQPHGSADERHTLRLSVPKSLHSEGKAKTLRPDGKKGQVVSKKERMRPTSDFLSVTPGGQERTTRHLQTAEGQGHRPGARPPETPLTSEQRETGDMRTVREHAACILSLII